MSAAEAKTVICETHGEFTSKPFQIRTGGAVFWTSCQQCKDDEKAAQEESRRAAELEAERKRIERRIASSGIPRRFLGASLSGWDESLPGQKAVGRMARDYVNQFPEILDRGRSAVFVGNVGTGKTHLACAVGLELLRSGYSVRYSTVIGAIDRVKATWDRESREETESDAMAAFTDPHLLILDEVGVQFSTDTERQILFRIFDSRYGDVLPTIVISNLATAKLKEFLGERVSDRLKDDVFGLVGFNWDSRR